jgi:hypothetical protein
VPTPAPAPEAVEAEPVVEPEPVVDPHPVVEFVPVVVPEAAAARAIEPPTVSAPSSLDAAVQTRLQRVWVFIRRRRRLFLAAGIVVVTIVLVVGPALARARQSSRWERCVERVMGHNVDAGDRVSAAAVETCGLSPADRH